MAMPTTWSTPLQSFLLRLIQLGKVFEQPSRAATRPLVHYSGNLDPLSLPSANESSPSSDDAELIAKAKRLEEDIYAGVLQQRLQRQLLETLTPYIGHPINEVRGMVLVNARNAMVKFIKEEQLDIDPEEAMKIGLVNTGNDSLSLNFPGSIIQLFHRIQR
jgi:hypothetical protein